MDDLIREFAAVAEDIYNKRTAGDYTWDGFLAHFMREAVDQGIVTINN